MLISAVSDLDPLRGNYELFFVALQKAKMPDLLLFAGDMYERNMPENYKIILNYIERIGWDVPIVAVFGNREFEQEYDKIKEICGKRVRFLVDESLTIKISGRKIGIVGSKGCLDQPTWWQMTNIPRIREIYRQRAEKISELLKALRTEVKILLTHYAPTYRTLKGENPNAYGGLGYKNLERALVEAKATFAVHGHAHFGTQQAFIASIPIFNVAFPVNKKIVEIDMERLLKAGLAKFV